MFSQTLNTPIFKLQVLIVVETCNGPVALSAVYCPPPKIISKVQFRNIFSSLGCRFFAGGNYIKAIIEAGGKIDNSAKAWTLQSYNWQSTNISVSTGKPSYQSWDSNEVPCILDLFVIKGIAKNIVS